MDPFLFQGSTLTRVTDEIHELLTTGEVTASWLQSFARARDAGLWAEQDGRVVATSELVTLADRLPNPEEAAPAVLSLLPEVRSAWKRIVLARLRDMGERNDMAALAEAVTAAGPLSRELVEGVSPSLAATAYGELERLVLPNAAHEAPAFPVLLRVLAATASLGQAPRIVARGAPPMVVWDDPSQTWQTGRLIRPPALADPAPPSTVLTGALDDNAGDGDPVRWALMRPWAYLLAQLVFTKEAWEAERISGSIAFELEQAQLPLFQNPPRVDVVVTLPSGEEVRCGSLGELTLQTLAQLGVTVFAHQFTSAVLDDRLSIVVEALLRREVWRFDHGTGGRRPGYTIHPSFSDACYRALGSRAFYRLGSPITAAVRRVAETWARDRVARSGASSAGGTA